MKMPAKSVTERYAASRNLDAVAIPLIPQLGIAAAYIEAMRQLSRKLTSSSR